MSISTIIFWLVLLGLVIYVISIYNSLVTLKNRYLNAFSQIEVQLKRRYDLIPNLVETAKAYMAHERETLEAVTAARNDAAAILKGMGNGNVDGAEIAKLASAEGVLQGALGKLNVTMEAYPDLKASDNFLELQTALASVEDEIQMARRYYNGATRNLNILVESFPSNLVAGAFGFATRDYFEIADADRAVPEVALGR